MKKQKSDKHSWRSIYESFMEKASEAMPRLLPSGRIKFPGKIDYRAVVEKASRSMIRFKRPERLIRMIVRVIAEQVKVTHTGVLLYNEKKDSYVLIDSKGESGKMMPVGFVRIPHKSELIDIFNEENSLILDERGALTRENLMRLLNDKELIVKDKKLLDRAYRIKAEIDLLRANICIPSYFKRKLLGILLLGPKLSGGKFNDEEIGFFTTLANDAAMATTNAQLIEDLQKKVKEIAHLYEREHRLFMHTSVALAAAIDARDTFNHGHTERVTQYAFTIAEELTNHPEVLKLENFDEALHIASLLHDVGKIGIPDNILNKTGQLTIEEFNKIKEHPEIGATILKPIKELGNVIHMVKCHQEKYDGSGYPDGLRGKEIPFISRIIAVADSFDAMTTNRPYRGKKHVEEAVKEIERNSGKQYDPDIVKAFITAYKKGKLINISNMHHSNGLGQS